MSRVSCIEHPARSPFSMTRQSYMTICDGDACAAALLSAFEQWTNTRLSNREERGGDAWVFRTLDQVAEVDLVGVFERKTVMKGVETLIAFGYLTRRRNPRLRWDRTWQYHLNVEAVQGAINRLNMQSTKTDYAKSQNGLSKVPKRTSNTEDSLPDSSRDRPTLTTFSEINLSEEVENGNKNGQVEVEEIRERLGDPSSLLARRKPRDARKRSRPRRLGETLAAMAPAGAEPLLPADQEFAGVGPCPALTRAREALERQLEGALTTTTTPNGLRKGKANG